MSKNGGNIIRYQAAFISDNEVNKLIKEIRGVGLMLCLIMTNAEIADKLVLEAKNQGLILFWLLIEKRAVRITPPLTISKKEIEDGCNIILNILDSIQ